MERKFKQACRMLPRPRPHFELIADHRSQRRAIQLYRAQIVRFEEHFGEQQLSRAMLIACLQYSRSAGRHNDYAYFGEDRRPLV
eukprot:469252-Hanusia_phi.AAC.1